METIRTLASALGILVFLVLMKQRVSDALAAIGAPASLDFYFLFFWALAAALVGGLAWGACQRLSPSLNARRCSQSPSAPTPTLGGSREPHGIAAWLWPVVTNVPILVLFVFFAVHYQLFGHAAVVRLASVFLLGLSLSSAVFYDLPLFGNRGFRCWLNTRGWRYEVLELALVLIWSTILSVIPFFLVHMASNLGWFPLAPISGMVEAVGLTVGMTSLVVTFFVVTYPNEKFESARGILAGLTLRVSLFLGLVLAMNDGREIGA